MAVAVTKITSISTYIGLSTDTKPTGVPVGSRFYEYDTCMIYECYDGTLWAAKTTPRGIEVQRATANLPQSAQAALFTISGGRVLLLDFIGKLTAIAGGSVTIRAVANPTVGADVNLCVAVDINGDDVGTLYALSGVVTDGWGSSSSGVLTGAQSMGSAPMVIPIGTIDLLTNASRTGKLQWTLHYLPLEAGASVVVA